MANPFPFSSGDILTAADMNSIGDWLTFTPSFTNVTLGASGAVTGRYAEVNNLVFYAAKFDLGGTGSVTGHVSMAPPAGTADSSTTYQVTNQVWARPTGGTIYHGMGFAAGSSIFYYSYAITGSYVYAVAMNATGPTTWNSSGLFYCEGWYAKA